MRRLAALLTLLLVVLPGCGAERPTVQATAAEPFTIAVIPDTQNYLSYKTEKSHGFALDASELFLAQMADIASRAQSNGGDLAFVAAVGDVWQHQSIDMDEDHRSRGFEAIPNPYFGSELAPSEQTRAFELPKAVEGYRLLAATGTPFGVAPGNHDYDAMWSAAGYPPNLAKSPAALTMTVADLGMLHIGGLDNFRSVFGDDSEFFSGKPWYVASHKGGASSAQVFKGGGYTFLNINLEMAAGDMVLAWAQSVIDAHPGKPTIITTHDYLNTRGERRANPLVDLNRVDPEGHNSAEDVWRKLIAPNDQVFLVLCGHHHGQGRRVDENAAGNPVYQLLADYQSRGQAGLDAGQPPNPGRGPAGIGDGWYRLMRFDLGDQPSVQVTTWSSHYRALSTDLDSYADWYKHREQPQLTDTEFHATDSFTLDLAGFHQRFGGSR